MRLKDKLYAIKLRKQGHSYQEIIEKIPNLSKGTLSHWLSYLELTPKEQKHLEKRIKIRKSEGRFRAAETNRQRRIQKMEKSIRRAEKEVPQLIRNPLFLMGLALYWCEGTQKTQRFSFINSDPIVIKTMIKWLTKVCKIQKKSIKLRLYIHHVYAHENCEEFWSKLLEIALPQFSKTVYKPTPHIIKRNPDYKGCLRIDCGGVELFRKFLGWRNGTLKYLKLE